MVVWFIVWTGRLGRILMAWWLGMARVSGITCGVRGLCRLDWLAWEDLIDSSCLWLGCWGGEI